MSKRDESQTPHEQRLRRLSEATLAALYAGDDEAVATGAALVEAAKQVEDARDDE